MIRYRANGTLSFLAPIVSFSLANLAQPARSEKPGATQDDSVVATVAGKPIRYSQVRQELGARLARLEIDYLTRRYKLERRALEKLVDDTLLEAEAKRRKLEVSALLKTEIEDKVKPAAEADVKAFYEEVVKPRGMDYDAVKDRIGQLLQERSRVELRKKLVDRLRSEAKVQFQLARPEIPKIEVPVGENPARGNASAAIAIVEFSDFQCPFCGRATKTVEQVLKKYAGKVKLYFRHFPLDFHEDAKPAAEASQCAGEQGKFWEYHDALFQDPQKLTATDLRLHAKAVGLDAAKFEACVKSGKHQTLVARDIEEGRRLGVNGTPAFFINGQLLSGAQPLEAFSDIVDGELTRLGGK